jgi:peptidoglycan/xylan/chitin deacetylase (PgdA/CDA1 family)
MSSSPWPNSAKAAVSFTMDNLGEAQELNAGLWPLDQPVGHHFSVKKALPRMLQILDDCDVKATCFFESWSANVYPDVVKDVVGRGHEIGWHGFQHEMWSELSPKEEEENFKKSFAEADKLSWESNMMAFDLREG